MASDAAVAKTDFDYIIIGSGIAGLNTALLAREHGSVLIVTKGKIDDCNTRYAQGGIAAAIGAGDSTTLHMQDTLAAGVGLCDPEAVSVLTREGPQRVANLIQWGVPFDTIHGQIALAREGAHSVPRILHAGGDATGQHIELTLAGRVEESDITVLEFTLATDLVVERGVVTGVRVLDLDSDKSQIFTGRWVVLATGGAGQLYWYTTNPLVATGDGAALAFRAGARMMDMEFYQFHPTALRLEGVPGFLLSEAMRGEGAVLRDQAGYAFMADYHPMADLAPRDIVSRAISAEIEKASDGQVFLDISHLPADMVQSRFPTIYSFCMSHGLDITKGPVPIAPAAHYMMGGVETDTWGRTNLGGLYACGEVACAAVHGANRLASNSLLDTLVFAQRVVASTLDQAPPPSPSDQHRGLSVTLRSREPGPGSIPPLTVPALQDLMWRDVGITRRGEGLLEAARTLEAWSIAMPEPTGLASHELGNMVLLGRLMAEAALVRQESRGSHYREDYPETSPEWEKHVVLVKEE
ncbi:MAG: L-aspartate oxidase [Chloroflexi bacterium]|nr:L-aspartate oxidase [Chloroflexota bacterium]